MTTVLRTEPLPRLMQNLPVDPDRGFVVPWFVDWIDGKPEFRAMDIRKFKKALTKKLCWVCGNPLLTRFAFVAGPMCGINKISSEPPSHIECARWSARNCPFLSNPDMVRREDDLVDNNKFRDTSAGIGLARNPRVTMLWITREYEVVNVGNGILIVMGRAQEVEWYHCGRIATRKEVVEAVEEGISLLEATARQEEGGLEDLRKKRSAFEQRWLPSK
jgi:hypothetical protein